MHGDDFADDASLWEVIAFGLFFICAVIGMFWAGSRLISGAVWISDLPKRVENLELNQAAMFQDLKEIYKANTQNVCYQFKYDGVRISPLPIDCN